MPKRPVGSGAWKWMWLWSSTSTGCAVTWLSHQLGYTPMKCTWTPVTLLILVWPVCLVSKSLLCCSGSFLTDTVFKSLIEPVFPAHWNRYELFCHLKHALVCCQTCPWRACACVLLFCSPSTTPWRASSCPWWSWDRRRPTKTASQRCCVRQKVKRFTPRQNNKTNYKLEMWINKLPMTFQEAEVD